MVNFYGVKKGTNANIFNMVSAVGTRTHDPMIKSHVLYHLSYALTCRAV